MARKAKPQPVTLRIPQKEGETYGAALAGHVLSPGARHGHIASIYANGIFGEDIERPNLGDYTAHVRRSADKAEAGDLALVSRTMATQAIALDAMFTELARRSAEHLGNNLDAVERYVRLALKAQSNSRATFESLAKLHQPREQTVRHVHVNQGGQAIVAEQFHHHGGGAQNAESIEQCHAAGRAGAGTALPSPDAIGHAMPSPGGVRPQAVPDARRD